jgi:selenophosphate synthase
MPDGPGTDLMVGAEHGDDGAVVRVGPAMAVVVTADFSLRSWTTRTPSGGSPLPTPLSDIYAMGGEPLVAVNLLGRPRDKHRHGRGRRARAAPARGRADIGRTARGRELPGAAVIGELVRRRDSVLIIR